MKSFVNPLFVPIYLPFALISILQYFAIIQRMFVLLFVPTKIKDKHF